MGREMFAMLFIVLLVGTCVTYGMVADNIDRYEENVKDPYFAALGAETDEEFNASVRDFTVGLAIHHESRPERDVGLYLLLESDDDLDTRKGDFVAIMNQWDPSSPWWFLIVVLIIGSILTGFVAGATYIQIK